MSDETKTPAETYAEHNGANVTPETACQCADCQAHAAAAAPAAAPETTLQKVEQTASVDLAAIESAAKAASVLMLQKFEALYEKALEEVRAELANLGA